MTDNLTSCNTLQELAAAQARGDEIESEVQRGVWLPWDMSIFRMARRAYFGGWADIDWFCPWYSVHKWPKQAEER